MHSTPTQPCQLGRTQVNAALKDVMVEEWGKVQCTDSEAGDTMWSCSLGTHAEDSRDATYVQPFPVLEIDEPTTYILVAICNCVLQADDGELEGLDIHFCSREGVLDVIDITTVQSLVGQVNDLSNEWAIIDQSGFLARAEWLGEEGDGE
ncbi:hypothetical protein DFH07DRAFT_775934 [Mycena maculata]|uniref:Uncharacterized protein n=1 Tax=Mycena maculata TaxID=230809 RepID=A0AAD7IPZ8_9AGAR|nr:hypothetical protein DFH07DRAFT_775934 [Mycena maculata]